MAGDAIYGTFTRFSGPVKERGVMVLQIEIPEEHAKRVLDLLGFPESGTSTWVAVARLKERPVDKAKVERQKEILGGGEEGKRCLCGPAPHSSKWPGTPCPIHDKPKRKFHELPRSEQAGILCKDVDFRMWLAEYRETPIATHEQCSAVIKLWCSVQSRKELDKETPRYKTSPDHAMPWERWDHLVEQYKADTGRTAERRS